ncbi:MAG: hypothetical protein KKG33_06470, partial [candidate division Zixibacteria bacterium]|nr:hypothetical protein [candidate division Zixibacteria bacterium]
MSTTKKVLQVSTAMAFIVALFALAFGEVVPHPEDLEFKLSQTKVASPGSSWPSNPNASIGTIAPDGYNPGPSPNSVLADRPDKAAYNGPTNEVDPSKIRQGGDVCASATVIGALPYDDMGTTAGYADDYEEVGVFTCPYDSDSPDVVYSFTPGASMQITIDLCASGYDTKVIVYENDCAAAAY